MSRLLVETGDMRAISQTYWADCERFIFIMRPTFHALKMSDSNKPSLGFLYPMISSAATHMRTYDPDLYNISYKVRWELNNAGEPAVQSKVSLRESPVLEAAFCQTHTTYQTAVIYSLETN